MGEILGWAILAPTAAIEPTADTSADFDVDKLYDKTSLAIYWNVKIHYEKARRAFFDYVRKQNIQLHREQAKSALSHAANLQLLGDNGSGEKFLEEAKSEIERACQNAWRIYQTSGTPKRHEMKVLLLENLAEAQFVGLDESPTVRAMSEEAVRIMSI